MDCQQKVQEGLALAVGKPEPLFVSFRGALSLRFRVDLPAPPPKPCDTCIEQPCLTYAECLAVRRHCAVPFILDECMDSLDVLLKGADERAMDLINLKINRFGGLTRARLVRDLVAESGCLPPTAMLTNLHSILANLVGDSILEILSTHCKVKCTTTA